MRPPTHSSTRQAPSHALQGDRRGALRAVHVLGTRRKCPRGRKGTEGPPRGGWASQGRASGLSARKPAGVRSCHSRWGTRAETWPPGPGWVTCPGFSTLCRSPIRFPAPSRKDTPTIPGPAQWPVCWADPEFPACLSSTGSRLGACYAGSSAPSRAHHVPIKADLQGHTAFTASRNGPALDSNARPLPPGLPPDTGRFRPGIPVANGHRSACSWLSWTRNLTDRGACHD